MSGDIRPECQELTHRPGRKGFGVAGLRAAGSILAQATEDNHLILFV